MLWFADGRMTHIIVPVPLGTGALQVVEARVAVSTSRQQAAGVVGEFGRLLDAGWAFLHWGSLVVRVVEL